MYNYQNTTIAIVDSGIGGVAVLNKLLEKFKGGNYIYFADNLFMPYGNKTKNWLSKRLQYIISQLQEHYHVDCVIIACNTASSSVHETKYKNVFTLKFDKNKTYIATNATKRNLPDLNVISASNLAQQIEKNIFNDKKLDEDIKNCVKRLNLNSFNEIVLGCTHYELTQDLFIKHCPKTKIISNSEFILNDLHFKNITNETNIMVVLSQNNESLKDKIYKLIRR